jgi:hypothetical protein
MTKDITSITIIGRRWRQRSTGNTYCTATIMVNGVPVHRTEPEYGYGDYYEQAAWEWLAAEKIVDPERYAFGGLRPAHDYCREHGIAFHREVSDVTRERDL